MSRILVIDDSDVVREMLLEVLQGHGFAVDYAVDATQGYQKALECSPDLILLDVQLPDVTGFDLCRIIKNRDELKHVPIIMVTGTARATEEKVRGFQLGADDYLLKPFEVPELIERIRALLRRSAPRPDTPDMSESTIPPLEERSGPSRTEPPYVAAFLMTAVALLWGGLACAAGSSIRPTLAAVAFLALWGLVVGVVVVGCSLSGMPLSWAAGARLTSRAGVPLLFKFAGALVTSAVTTLSPFYFTAGPALFRSGASFALQRLDAFEIAAAVLLWRLLRVRAHATAYTAGVISGIAWLAVVLMSAGVSSLGSGQ